MSGLQTLMLALPLFGTHKPNASKPLFDKADWLINTTVNLLGERSVVWGLIGMCICRRSMLGGYLHRTQPCERSWKR